MPREYTRELFLSLVRDTLRLSLSLSLGVYYTGLYAKCDGRIRARPPQFCAGIFQTGGQDDA